VLGGVGIVAFGKGQFEAHAATVARIGGFPVIALFWWYQERVSQFFDSSGKIAIELEQSLRYKLYTNRPPPWLHLPSTSKMGRIFFMLLALLWLYAVIAVPPGS
jgi:hypothetical protein